MSAKVNIGITAGSLVLLLIIGAVVINGSLENTKIALQAEDTAEKARVQSLDNNKDLNSFISKWEKRIQISNQINNESKDRELSIQDNILNNLTSHRTITNQTFGTLVDFVNDRNAAFNTTLEKLDNITTQNKQLIIAFNATNEEERVKAVDRIIEQLHADHQIIMKGLNISSNDNKTDAETDIEKLKKAIETLELKGNATR